MHIVMGQLSGFWLTEFLQLHKKFDLTSKFFFRD